MKNSVETAICGKCHGELMHIATIWPEDSHILECFGRHKYKGEIWTLEGRKIYNLIPITEVFYEKK